MSVTITIPTALRQFAGGQSEINVDAHTAGEALERLTLTHAELRRHLFNDQNALRNFVNVIPIGRVGAPEEVARVILFLASGASSYLAGETVEVNGGMLME